PVTTKAAQPPSEYALKRSGCCANQTPFKISAQHSQRAGFISGLYFFKRMQSFRGKTSRRPFEPVGAEEICEHFGQSMSQLQKLRQARISTLEHNEEGQLVQVRA